MITTNDLDAMRQLNFGRRLLQRPITNATVGVEIDRYDAVDAARVTDAIRATAGVDLLAEQFIEIYENLRCLPMTPEADLRAIAESLSHLAKQIQLARPESISSIQRLVRRLARMAR
jgi:hypothetical protein